MTTPLSVKDSLSFGWKTFKSRPWLFVGSSLVYVVAEFILGWIESIVPGVVGTVISIAVGTLLAIGLMTLYLKAHDNLSGAAFKDMWNPSPFLKYLATTIVMAIVITVGFVLLIVPGIFLAIALSFAPYVVVERKVWVMTALKESWRLTEGNRWKLFLLALVVAAMNLVGALVFLVGLLLSVPLSLLALVHAYRVLQGRATQPVEAPASAPVPAA